MNDGATFFSLNQPEHWKRRGYPFNLDTASELRISSGQRYGGIMEIDLRDYAEVGEIVSMAAGKLGKLVLLDDGGSLWTNDRRNGSFERMFGLNHELISSGSMLNIADNMLIVADPEGEGSLSAFDITSGQARWRRTGREVEGLFYYPLALASDNGYVYVLSLVQEGQPGSLEEAELSLLIFTMAGTLSTAFADRRFVAGLLPSETSQLPQVHMAVSQQGSVYVYDSIGGKLLILQTDGSLSTQPVQSALPLSGIAVDSRQSIYIGIARSIDKQDEDDRFIQQLGEDGSFTGRITGFRGKTDALVIDERDRMYVYSKEKGTLTVLDLQPQMNNWPGTDTPRGVWISSAFDSLESGMIWHKFTLDGDIPDGTQLRIRYFASDYRELPIAGTIRPVDAWLGTGTESLDNRLAALDPYWSEPVINPQDALFVRAEGRYLWLCIEWLGSELLSPSLRRMRVYFPRDTLIGYLPLMYQEEESSRDFLERYLSLFATFFDSIEEQIDQLPQYFDRQNAEDARLRWLASWVGLAAGEHWSDSWVRKYILAAPELYRYRGTRKGMERIIDIFTGKEPIIIEWFQYQSLREQAELRWLSEMLYGDDPFTFTVLLHPSQAPGEKEKVLLRQLIDDFKPAHTNVRLVWLQPWMYVDLHTYLGVNSVLAEPSLLTIGGGKAIPNDTLLLSDDGNHRLDTHTRLEMDSELE